MKEFQHDLIIAEKLKKKKKPKRLNLKSTVSDLSPTASLTQLNRGNVQNIKSDDVAQIRSEVLCAKDYDRDDYHDMLLIYCKKTKRLCILQWFAILTLL